MRAQLLHERLQHRRCWHLARLQACANEFVLVVAREGCRRREACVSAPRGSSDICGLRGADPRCTARARNELDLNLTRASRSTLVAQANGQRGRAHALGWRLWGV